MGWLSFRWGSPRLLGRMLLNLALTAAVVGLVPAAAGAATPKVAAGGTAGPAAPVFTTVAPSRPLVRSGPADQITYQSARLQGQVFTGGESTAYFFLYGPTTAYGSQSLPISMVPGGKAVTVYSAITGLQPLTVYHYSLVAINALGTKFGTDQTLTTTAAPLTLTIGASANPDPFGAPITISGQTVGTGAAGSAVVLQQNPFPFTGGFQLVGSPGLASATGTFSFSVGVPPVSTQFRVVSVGPGQPLVSQTLTEFVSLAVTAVASRGPAAASGGPRAAAGVVATTFAGQIAPAEVGARVTVQRLVGGRWALVAATKAQAATAGISTYSLALHLTHSGTYRVFSTSIEGGHLASASKPVIVHVHGSIIQSP
jgi:hypothetical protein